ncbi:MAG TPA: glycosyltransferase family 39 protein [Chloroflexia bacterium]|jgi:4-amino-4-deoxy-L-arabinose transferase-like glycosyltransferase
MSQPPTRPGRKSKDRARTALLGVSLLLAFLGGVLLIVSFLPFELVERAVAPYIFRGNTNILTPAYYETIVARLRVGGVGLLLGGVLLFAFRRQVRAYFSGVATSIPLFRRDLQSYRQNFVRCDSRVCLYALLLIMLVGIVIRLAFLFQPMRNDEAFTVMRYASQPLWIGLSKYSTPNNHLFHTFLVHLSYNIFGNREWAIRLPALLAGIAVIPATYVLVRGLYGRHAALLAAGLVAASSPLVEYSTNARGYTLVTLFFLLLFTLALYLKRSNNLFGWLIFAIISALGFYTVPVMLYPFGIVVVWLVLSIVVRDSPVRRDLLLRHGAISLLWTALLTLLLYLPVLVTYGPGAIVANPYVTARSGTSFLGDLWAGFAGVWEQWDRDTPALLSLLLAIGFVVAGLLHAVVSRHRVPVVAAVLLWSLPVVLAQRVVPYARVWLFLLPLYLGIAAAGVLYPLKLAQERLGSYRATLGRVWPLVPVVTCALLAVSGWQSRSVYFSNDTGTLRDAEQIAIFLKDYLEPGDVLLAPVPSESPLAYYMDRYGVPLDYMYSGVKDKRRVLVVVNKPAQTLGGIVEESGLVVSGDNPPKLLKVYPEAELYELDNPVLAERPLSFGSD